MRIASVEAIPFRIPLTGTVRFATGELSAAEHVLVRVCSDDGRVGIGEAIPRPMIYGETTASVLEAIRRHVAPAVIGLDVTAVEAARHRLRDLPGNPAAKSGVELAVHDLLGKALEVPVWRLLGGFADSLACTAPLGLDSPGAVVEEAARLREEHGIESFKPKVGVDLEREVATIAALREAFGTAISIRPDANHGYSAAEAARFLDRTRELELAWIEEPCPASSPFERRRLVAAAEVPVVGDESCVDLAATAAELLAERCSMVSLKVARTGIVESRAIRDLCAGMGTGTVVGTQGESEIGTLASAAFAAAHPATAGPPAELTFFLCLDDTLVTEPLELTGGRLKLPERPGFGFEVDPEKLEHYRSGGWLVVGADGARERPYSQLPSSP